MARKEITPRTSEGVKAPDTRWMSLIFGPEAPVKEQLDKSEERKIALFEKGLAKEIDTTDTIDEAFTKIVRMALAAEFGPSFSKAKGAKGLIDTIVRGITGDSELRKQALLIIDRFAKK
jgi:hypothetical protein